MGKIIILDENTANKIAAGEVIERPASVIKELVENSIDAGATNISVEVRNGGISFIRVIDNGSGFADDDVEIAFERHATSKIRRADDLESLSSMGFRGEALASIAAVADVQLLTRVREAVQGVSIEVKGGCVLDVKPAGCPAGTSLTVRELFFNTPARYKFLKKDSTEAGYIADVMTRIALGYPDISFKLISGGTMVLHTPGNGDLKSAVFSVYGAETAKHLLEVAYDDGRVKIMGFVGKAELSRSNRNQQSVYINRRYIRNKAITAAIDAAYATFMMKNKYPFVLLDLRINPAMVDVNVHPSKMEVKFSSEQDIYRAVYHAVNSTLLSGSSVRTLPGFDPCDKPDRTTFHLNEKPHEKPAYSQEAFEWVRSELDRKRAEAVSVRPGEPERGEGFGTDGGDVGGAKNDRMNESGPGSKEREESLKAEIPESVSTAAEVSAVQSESEPVKAGENRESRTGCFQNELNVQDPAVHQGTVSTETSEGAGTISKPQCIKPIQSTVYEPEKDNTQSDVKSESIAEAEPEATYGTDTQKIFPDLFSGTRVIGQAFSTYILLERADELLLLDQHAAHERIRYEELKKAYAGNEPLSQTLLSVISIELTGGEFQFAMQECAFFEKLGFFYESFGTNSIILRAVPFNQAGLDIRGIFLEILDFVMNEGNLPKASIADESLYRLACKSAVKANKRLDEKEIEALLKRLAALENPYTCPHGRPAMLKLTKYEMEKLFKRIV